MEVLTQYSLWVEPQGQARDQLQEAIDLVAAHAGNPTFPPHVTLVGERSDSMQSVLERAESLAGRLWPFQLTFEDPTFKFSRDYFKATFKPLRKAASLLQAQAEAARDFNWDYTGSYEPHMSFEYSHRSIRSKRRAVMHLNPNLPGLFLASGLHVYRTGEDVAAWQQVAYFPFPVRPL